jgi:hypothetical protein
MRKENAWLNGGKAIENKTSESKTTGYDVPMDETKAHPNLVKPSDPDVKDEPIAMKWKNNEAKKE